MSTSTPQPLQSALLARGQDNGIAHGFFTRDGGVSFGIYQGLNVGLGSRDNRDHVLENRRRVASWFNVDDTHLVTVHQVHSPDVVVVTEPFGDQRPEVDAMVTAMPGLALGVLSADCGPILFADPVHRVIGAAHAGWKGALTGVLENTIEAMIGLGARRETIMATLGPSISASAYEVGPEFVARFIEHDPSYSTFFTPSLKPGHAMFDLPGLTVERLRGAGILSNMLGICTYNDSKSFYSYRRTTHAGEPDYGRQISAIYLREMST